MAIQLPDSLSILSITLCIITRATDLTYRNHLPSQIHSGRSYYHIPICCHMYSMSQNKNPFKDISQPFWTSICTGTTYIEHPNEILPTKVNFWTPVNLPRYVYSFPFHFRILPPTPDPLSQPTESNPPTNTTSPHTPIQTTDQRQPEKKCALNSRAPAQSAPAHSPVHQRSVLTQNSGAGRVQGCHGRRWLWRLRVRRGVGQLKKKRTREGMRLEGRSEVRSKARMWLEVWGE